MDGTGTYAPQSPDLSQFLGSGPAKAAADTTAFLHPRNAQSINQSQQQFYHYPPIPPLPTTHNQFGATEAYHVPTHSVSPLPHHHQPQYPTPTSYLQHSPPRSEDINRLSTAAAATDRSPEHNHNNTSYSAAASSAQQAMAQQAASSSSGGNDLGPSLGIEIKTKFPVARIKRIMQADEEVGKVAQVTPVAVSKALELFMISLCTKSASIARAGSSKRITAAHLKAAIEADDQFDFLNEITSKVAGPQESEAATGEKKGRSSRATKAQETKSEGDSEENVEKKVKTTRGRKKKSDAE